MSAQPTAEETKSCCAAAYGSDAVALVLGESYHPGGLRLTRRLADLLGLRTGEHVLDVASGRGATALLLAERYGVSVEGTDLAAPSVARATEDARAAGLAEVVRFRVGDAERMPFADGTFDAVVCECAFCTFPDKPSAARELERVLKPGGRLGLTDVTVAPTGLPPSLADLTGWVACLADARSLHEYSEILATAGLVTVTAEAHDDAIASMVDQIEARLMALRLLGHQEPALDGVDLDGVLKTVREARQAVAEGAAGYGLLIATKQEAPA